MDIQNIVNISMLDNEVQKKLAEEYDLTDVSQHMLAQTTDGKFFLLKNVNLIKMEPAGTENDPKDVTYTFTCGDYTSTVSKSMVNNMLSLWRKSLEVAGGSDK